jgi:hypothetical protein
MIRVEDLARLEHSESDMNKLAHRSTNELHFVFAVPR